MKVIDVVRMFMNERYIKEEKENLGRVLSESFIKGGYVLSYNLWEQGGPLLAFSLNTKGS